MKCKFERRRKTKERKDGGWRGIGPESGTFVPQQEAFTAACQECGIVRWNPDAQLAREFSEMLIEWYFSGNWIWEEEEDAAE